MILRHLRPGGLLGDIQPAPPPSIFDAIKVMNMVAADYYRKRGDDDIASRLMDQTAQAASIPALRAPIPSAQSTPTQQRPAGSSPFASASMISGKAGLPLLVIGGALGVAYLLLRKKRAGRRG